MGPAFKRLDEGLRDGSIDKMFALEAQGSELDAQNPCEINK